MIAAATAPVIRFEEEGHKYWVDGIEKRFWSQIVIDAGLDEEPLQTEWVINAKHRGRQIHEAAKLLIQGRPFDPQDLANESLPYVQAFLDYWGKHGEPGVAEQPLYCAELDFCITPDFYTPHRVTELKTTSDRKRAWGLQTAAQCWATGASQRRVLWLRPKLKTRSYEILEPPDARIFSGLDMQVVVEACRGEYDGPAITAWKALK